MYGGCSFQMTTRKYTTQDKEEAFTLYSQNWSYGDIAREMNKRYACKMSKSTVNRWAANEDWVNRRAKVMDEVRDITERKATTSIARAITMGQELQDMFGKQLKKGELEIRPQDAYLWTKMLLNLETSMEARDVLIDEVAQLSAEAMDKAGIPKQKQAAFAQHYTQMVKNLKGTPDD